MKQIISKRHPLKFYLSITLSSVFFLVMGTLMLWIFNKELNNQEHTQKVYFLLFASLAVYFMAFYSIYKYFKNAPSIEINRQFITIGKEKFSWTNLKEIELTGKQNFPYLISFPMEAISIRFNDAKTKIIFDDMYSNSWEIKSFIKNVIIDKNDFYASNFVAIDNNEIQQEEFEIYKGNQFTSIRGISLWGMLGFLLFLILSKKKIPPLNLLLVFGLFGTIWFVAHSYLMNYFLCSTKYFVVKNHNYFWKSTIFKLSDIKEIVFESQAKQPNCLRIITKDFRNKFYPAATLSDDTWLELKDVLEENKIKVRNECIYEEK